MASIEIKGARTFDGRYPLIQFNRYEQGQIRRLSGWMPLQYEEALAGGDAEFIAALAVLAMKRKGRIEREEVAETYEEILDIDGAEIRLIGDAEEESNEPRPPTENSNSSSDISTPDSRRSSETSATTPKDNGTDDSATSGLPRVRSVS
jgi:hypothetical protein